MKRRRKMKLDLLSGNTAAVLLLGALFLLGGALGCAAAGNVRGEAGAALEQYINAYLTLAGGSEMEVRFFSVLWEQMRFPLLALLMGFTAVGIIGIPALFAVRGFVFAFSVACFCRLFGTAGLIPALFLFGLPALIWAPALFVLGMQTLGASCSMLRRCVGDSCRPEFCEGDYWVRCALCACAVALCVALEYLVLPALVGASARFVL